MPSNEPGWQSKIVGVPFCFVLLRFKGFTHCDLGMPTHKVLVAKLIGAGKLRDKRPSLRVIFMSGYRQRLIGKPGEPRVTFSISHTPAAPWSKQCADAWMRLKAGVPLRQARENVGVLSRVLSPASKGGRGEARQVSSPEDGRSPLPLRSVPT